MTNKDSRETQGASEKLASAASSDVIIELGKINKWHREFHVLKDIDLVVHKGERIVVCGPSGLGNQPSSAVSTSLKNIKPVVSWSMV
jgi:ABC-type transporter Mla maintaining outer membrane lipid asymmetry ATPase subunit MlaF